MVLQIVHSFKLYTELTNENFVVYRKFLRLLMFSFKGGGDLFKLGAFLSWALI